MLSYEDMSKEQQEETGRRTREANETSKKEAIADQAIVLADFLVWLVWASMDQQPFEIRVLVVECVTTDVADWIGCSENVNDKQWDKIVKKPKKADDR